jgi:hypothetical protein
VLVAEAPVMGRSFHRQSPASRAQGRRQGRRSPGLDGPNPPAGVPEQTSDHTLQALVVSPVKVCAQTFPQCRFQLSDHLLR